MRLLQTALGVGAPDLFDGVDKKNLVFSAFLLIASTNDDAGLHRRIVKEVGSKTDNAFY